MHGFALGLSKIVKECLADYCSNPSKITTATIYGPGQPSSFQSIKQTVISLTDEFLKFMERHSLTSRLRIGFVRKKKGRGSLGFSQTLKYLGYLRQLTINIFILYLFPSEKFWTFVVSFPKGFNNWSSYNECRPPQQKVYKEGRPRTNRAGIVGLTESH